MKAFESAKEMLAAHEAMFGSAGKQAAKFVLKWAPRLFQVAFDPLAIRIVLAPHEMGAYNRHAGYCACLGGDTFLLGNRHHVKFHDNDLVLKDAGDFEDFVVHELTHARQAELLLDNKGRRGWTQHTRGVHRDKAWFAAVAEAAPNYLGIALPERIWPKRHHDGRLTEVELCHWPRSIRGLAAARDPRLHKAP